MDTTYLINGFISQNPKITIRCQIPLLGEIKFRNDNIGSTHIALVPLPAVTGNDPRPVSTIILGFDSIKQIYGTIEYAEIIIGR